MNKMINGLCIAMNLLTLLINKKINAMAEIIKMPRLSDTMEEGNIVGWLKKVGDSVEPGDVLAEVETDKATMELESFHKGTLLYIGVKEGPVAVDGIIAVIGKKGEDFKKQIAAEEKAAEENQKEVKEKEKPAPELVKPAPKTVSVPVSTKAGTSAPAATTVAIPSNDSRIKASPLAKKLAKENKINLLAIEGSGEGGRIIKKDIDLFLKNPRPIVIGGPAKKKDDKIALHAPADTVYGDVPLSQMRKVIARRLGESKFSAPHFYLTLEINMSKAIELRKGINKVATTRISFNDMVVKACALALRAHPGVNSSWLEDRIRVNQDINIGVAVAVPDGLLVPVIHNADAKNMALINGEVKALAGKAKSKKLQPEEMQGNTFTISNLGMFGIEEFTAIINPPDACIMAVGGIIEKPVVDSGQIVVGNMMKVTLSCDHRVVDGATGAAFLQTVKQLLEDPVTLVYSE